MDLPNPVVASDERHSVREVDLHIPKFSKPRQSDRTDRSFMEFAPPTFTLPSWSECKGNQRRRCGSVRRDSTVERKGPQQSSCRPLDRRQPTLWPRALLRESLGRDLVTRSRIGTGRPVATALAARPDASASGCVTTKRSSRCCQVVAVSELCQDHSPPRATHFADLRKRFQNSVEVGEIEPARWSQEWRTCTSQDRRVRPSLSDGISPCCKCDWTTELGRR